MAAEHATLHHDEPTAGKNRSEHHQCVLSTSSGGRNALTAARDALSLNWGGDTVSIPLGPKMTPYLTSNPVETTPAADACPDGSTRYARFAVSPVELLL